VSIQETAPEPSITKAEFARRRGVSRPRVTQWIQSGKISGIALDGEGPSAKIRESIAVAQLNEKLDVDQRFANGLGTRLDLPPSPQPPTTGDVLPFDRKTGAPPSDPAVDSVEKQIARERLESLQRQNREGARNEAEKNGRLTDAGLAAQQTGKAVAQVLGIFEGALQEFASAIAAKHQLPQRDLVHLLRGEFRKVRASAAAAFRREAEALPAMAEFEIVEDEQTTV
jgi:hypothetical protein